jgi:glucokinase
MLIRQYRQSVMASPEADFVELNLNALQSQAGNIEVVAAGAGLGEALMVCDGATHRAIATEGGHAYFTSSDQQQIGLLNYLMQKYDGHVSYERLLSVHGLINIYDRLKQIQFASVNVSTENKMLTNDPAAVIGMAELREMISFAWRHSYTTQNQAILP